MTYVDKEEKFWRRHIKSRRITDEATPSFKLKPMGDEEILRIALDYEATAEGVWHTRRVIAQAAQLDGARQVMEWGNEFCHNRYHHLPRLIEVAKRYKCPQCWAELEKESK